MTRKKGLSVPVKPSRKEMPPRTGKDLEFPEEIEARKAAGKTAGAGKKAAPGKSGKEEVLPWEEAWVREDVKKMLPVYFPESVYLKLKYISENSRVSMNEFVREAVMARLDDEIAEIRERR